MKIMLECNNELMVVESITLQLSVQELKAILIAVETTSDSYERMNSAGIETPFAYRAISLLPELSANLNKAKSVGESQGFNFKEVGHG